MMPEEMTLSSLTWLLRVSCRLGQLRSLLSIPQPSKFLRVSLSGNLLGNKNLRYEIRKCKSSFPVKRARYASTLKENAALCCPCTELRSIKCRGCNNNGHRCVQNKRSPKRSSNKALTKINSLQCLPNAKNHFSKFNKMMKNRLKLKFSNILRLKRRNPHLA
ncbi:unnamed protein product [Moneuplotes crassus]|uniref:Uncharacterized protein n=1 Tax=Euplotes crassus TaxID=5936 RepID=A0AAD1Y9M4_EUPCR|nr:unnamed protein product [Moneuplotes crassus]